MKVKSSTINISTIAIDDAYNAFEQRCKAKNVSHRTLEFYEGTAGRFIEWLKCSGVNAPELVTERHVTGYIAGLRDSGVSDNTINAHARAIRTMLIYWHEQDFTISRIKFEMPKTVDTLHRVLTIDELDTILKAAQTPRDRAIIAFMVDSGARRQEICNLNWENIDMKTGAVQIIRGKGRKNRWVGISPITIKHLISYRRTGIDVSPECPVFSSSRDGQRMSGQSVLLMFRRIAKIVGFSFHPHALRHTYATNARMEGMDIYEIQQTMGHADIRTTENYIKSLPSKIVERQVSVSPMMKLSKRRK
jgi:integrase/recombinase XerD